MDRLKPPSRPAAPALSERLCVSMCWLVKRLGTGCCAAPEKCRRAGRVWGRGSEEGNGVTLCTVVQRCSSGSPHCTEGLPTGWELMGLALHTLFPRPHWSVHRLGSRFLGSLLGEIPGGPSRMRIIHFEFRSVCTFMYVEFIVRHRFCCFFFFILMWILMFGVHLLQAKIFRYLFFPPVHF